MTMPPVNNNAFAKKWLFMGVTGVFRAIGVLPWAVLHAGSTVLFYVIRYGFRYRVRVVEQNIARLFPDKSLVWRNGVRDRFYRHFADVLVETLKTSGMSREDLSQRFKCVTPEVIRELAASGTPVTGFSSHLGNWEWLALKLAMDMPHTCYGVYKPLSFKALDRWMQGSRARFGLQLIPFTDVSRLVRGMVGEGGERASAPILLGLLADQRPHRRERADKVRFFGRETAFFPGGRWFTDRTGATPIFGFVRKVGRSRYEWGIEILNDKTKAREESPCGVTQAFADRLEFHLRAQPEIWLWTHDRFKGE